MNKIVLNGVDIKRFTNLIKRSASMDNLIFITVDDDAFESVAYNKNKSALKSVNTSLSSMCQEFSNNCTGSVRIQFGNANKFISVLSLVGTENVNIVFDIDDSGYARKVNVSNDEVSMNVPCADQAAVSFLEIPAQARENIFKNDALRQFRFTITNNEFKYMNSLFGLNKDSIRVFFNIDEDQNVYLSEIESTDDNVRAEVNEIVTNDDVTGFVNYEKLYNKKLNTSVAVTRDGDQNTYLGCFNKQYFVWIDNDDFYDIEFHSNKVKFISHDESANIDTVVVLTPVRF